MDDRKGELNAAARVPYPVPMVRITPEARQWILNRVVAGATVEVVVGELVAAGWHRRAAVDALRNVVGDSMRARVALSVTESVPPLPDPTLNRSPLALDGGDRRVRVLSSLQTPHVVVFGDLLDADECAGLIAAAEPRLQRSETANRRSGRAEIDSARTSRGMFFRRGESELIARVEQRIARLLNWPIENGEGLQVLHYRPGDEYEPHYDYFDPADPGTPALLENGGQRVASLIIYLNAPEHGGATTFPAIGLDVMPQRGNAVFFNYARPDPSTQTLHGGAPVLAGEKWIATKWLRERVFNEPKT